MPSPPRSTCCLSSSTPWCAYFILISNGVIRIFGGKTIKEGPFVTEGDIKALVSAAEEQDVIEEEEKKLIHSIFEFGDTLCER